jgi:serine/threonine protein kinase
MKRQRSDGAADGTYAQFPRWLGNPVRNGRLLTETYVSLDSFGPPTFLDEGEAAQVSLAKLLSSGRFYALKGIRKSWIYKARAFDDVSRQLSLHVGSTHRFICNMFRAFDHHAFVFVMQEYCVGGTLQLLLDVGGSTRFTSRRLSTAHARFYCAEIASALHYLHKERSIVFRNLHPSNVGISWNGHVKLLGFGRAVPVSASEPYVATVSNELHYGGIDLTAPELVPSRLVETTLLQQLKERPGGDAAAEAKSRRRAGELDRRVHSFEVDWWALGVLLHRLVLGFYPFRSTWDSTQEVARRIVSNRRAQSLLPTMPLERRRLRREGLYELLDRLLVPDPTRRWGEPELRACVFFAPLGDWALLHSIPAPHAPLHPDLEADTASFRGPQKRRAAALKVGVYPSEVAARPTPEQLTYTYFTPVCQDVMRAAMANHTLRSRRELDRREQERQGGEDKSDMLVKLDRGLQRITERRRITAERAREQFLASAAAGKYAPKLDAPPSPDDEPFPRLPSLRKRAEAERSPKSSKGKGGESGTTGSDGDGGGGGGGGTTAFTTTTTTTTDSNRGNNNDDEEGRPARSNKHVRVVEPEPESPSAASPEAAEPGEAEGAAVVTDAKPSSVAPPPHKRAVSARVAPAAAAGAAPKAAMFEECTHR